MYRRLWFKY